MSVSVVSPLVERETLSLISTSHRNALGDRQLFGEILSSAITSHCETTMRDRRQSREERNQQNEAKKKTSQNKGQYPLLLWCDRNGIESLARDSSTGVFLAFSDA